MGRGQDVDRKIRLERSVQGRLGTQLRAVYEPFSAGPIPDEHVDLLLALRRKERERRAQEGMK